MEFAVSVIERYFRRFLCRSPVRRFKEMADLQRLFMFFAVLRLGNREKCGSGAEIHGKEKCRCDDVNQGFHYRLPPCG